MPSQYTKWLYLLCFLTVFLTSMGGYSQVEKAKETYENGQARYKGKFLKCTTQEKEYPYISNYEKRPFGKWIYYYPSGVVSEVKNYTKKVRKCNQPILKEGEWKYFNEDGILYLTEEYVSDTLVYSEIAICEGSSLIAKITTTKSSSDTVYYVQKGEAGNLIQNPSFEQYFYKPIPIVNDGKNQIEELIPFWYSPDQATPDYYNQYRKVASVPEHFNNISEKKNSNGYIGLMLYRGEKQEAENSLLIGKREKEDHLPEYKESIQSKLTRPLTKGKAYCFKGKLLLSQNSGYSINQFEVLFSESPVRFSYKKFPGEASLSFQTAVETSKEWIPLCEGFVASGKEAYITLGRFSKPDQSSIKTHKPKEHSNLELNRAAYLLLDELALYEVDTLGACGCKPEMAEIIKPVVFEETGLNEVTIGDRFILNELQFAFDKAEIKSSFLPELERLFELMKRNPSFKIVITGHSDDTGTEDYNKKLSAERALSIKEWLLKNGIDDSRIQTKGVGNEFPLVENSSIENRKNNRRVEFEVTSY